MGLTVTKATPRPSILPQWRDTDTRPSIAGHSGRVPCLIPSTNIERGNSRLGGAMGRKGVTVRADLVPEAVLELRFSDHRREAVCFRCLRLLEFCLHAGQTYLACRGVTAEVEFIQYRFEAERRLAQLAEPAGETDLAVGWFGRAAAGVPSQSKMVAEWFVPWPGCWEPVVFTPGS